MKALLGFSSGLLLLEHERHPLRFLNISHSPAQQGVREFGVRVLENARSFTRSRHLHWLGKKQEATQTRFCNNSRSSDAALHMNNVGTRNGEDDDGDVRYYIRRIREALGAEACVNGLGCFSVSGTQTLLGMEGQWRMTWTSEGQFWEQFDGSEMTLEWAYDGRNASWAVDAAGRVSTLELDDREVCILAAWIRTSFWVTQGGQEQLHICVEEGEVREVERSSSEMMLAVKLRESKVVAYVIVDNKTWYPLRASIKAFGGWCKWQYSDWQPLLKGLERLFPFSSIHTQASGNKEVYFVHHFLDRVLEEDMLSKYHLPKSMTVSRPQHNHPCTHIDSNCIPSVQMIRADSGHYLVRPLVNGEDIGYFMLDTGASSLTIVPQKARELGLNAFGEVHLTCAEGKAKSQYCRADSFQLGPLRIQNPMFMEVPLARLANGASPALAGICGYDIFCHCVVEMAHGEGTLSLFDPLMYRPSCGQALQWHTMKFIENVPHVLATFNGRTALFMFDIGAGGVDVIFNGRCVDEFDLLSVLRPESLADLMGIGTSGPGLQVKYAVLDKLEVAMQVFHQVSLSHGTRVKEDFCQKYCYDEFSLMVHALLTNTGELDTSEYTAGLLCGDLLTRAKVVFDYEQRRFAFASA